MLVKEEHFTEAGSIDIELAVRYICKRSVYLDLSLRIMIGLVSWFEILDQS